MARKTIDCRTMPSESNCTVQISGEEDEVLELAVQHAVSVHGHADDQELRDRLRAALRNEEALHLEEGAFVQLIEFHAHSSAMRNSEHPVTTEISKRMQEVTEGEASFRNLNVVHLMRT